MLGAPDHFAQTVDGDMLGVHGVAVMCQQAAVAFGNPRRLVDGELLGQGQMHRQMQKWIDLAGLGGIVPVAVAVWRVEQGVIFGMGQHDFERRLLRAGKRLPGAIAGPQVEEELANLLAAGVEHARGQPRPRAALAGADVPAGEAGQVLSLYSHRSARMHSAHFGVRARHT